MIAPTPFFADRGCHVRILEEGRILTRRGHQVLVATYHHGRDVAGVRTVRTPSIPWYQELAPGPSPHKLYVDCLLIMTSLKAAARFRPHIIHAHLHEGVFVGEFVRRATGAPLVADFQGSLAGEVADHTRGGLLKRLARSFFTPIEHWLTQVPDRIVSSSSRFAESLADHRPRGGIALLADAVDTERFRPGLGSDASRISSGFRRAGWWFLGVLTPYQAWISARSRAARARFPPRHPTSRHGLSNVEAYAAAPGRSGSPSRSPSPAASNTTAH